MRTQTTVSKKVEQSKTSKKNGSTAPRTSPTVTIHEPEHRPYSRKAANFVRGRDLKDTAGLNKERLLEIYRYLFETRRLDEHLVALYRQNQVVGGVYGSLGQEATAVGCAYALHPGDFLQPLIRDMGAMLVHGASPLSMLRQYMAKGTGPSGGRDLNNHFSDPAVGLLGPVSMLGAMIPVLAGCLLASRLKNEKRAGLAFIGDGGSSTGAFYEGVNFAVVQKLPLIIVIEANHYAYSTSTEKQVAGGDLVRRASGFGCPVYHVDGNDPLACYEATRIARRRGMLGEGASIIITDTYRRKGHAEHDNQAYVPKEEINDWAKNNDPLERYLRFLLDGKHATASELEGVRQQVENELNTARDQSVTESFPTAQTVTHGVFDDGTQPWPAVDSWFKGGARLRDAAAARGQA